MVDYGWYTVVCVVGAHDAVGTGVDDRSLEGGEPCRSHLALSAVHRSGIETLFWGTEAYEVLYHSANIVGLHSGHVGITYFTGQVAVLSVGFFDTTIAELTGEIHDRSLLIINSRMRLALGLLTNSWFTPSARLSLAIISAI